MFLMATYEATVERLNKQGEFFKPYRSTVPEGRQGQWYIKRFEIAIDMQNLRMCRDGRGCSPGEFTMLVRGNTTVMSDTDAEVNDFLPFVKAAFGDVLVSGLGLGCVTAALLAKPEVTSVTVIEIDADVIALVAPHLACDRLTIVNADITKWTPAKGQRFDIGWHDIWDTITSDNLPEITHIKRRLAKRVKRQLAWCEREARENC